MRVFFCDMHNTIVSSFAHAFKHIGFDLCLAGHGFNPGKEGFTINYGRKWSQEEIDREIGLDNVYAVEPEELIEKTPDVFMIMCAEQQNDQLNIWRQIKDKPVKLAWYSGNDNTGNYYDQTLCQNLLSADISSYASAMAKGKHTLYYFPWIDYETYSFQGVSDQKIFRSYINNYKQLFPGGYQISEQVMSLFPDVKWQPADGLAKERIPELMKNSMATLHNKELEGYGYAIIESIACGRPVIIYKPYSHNRSYQHWCLEEQTAIYFTTMEEFESKVGRFLNDQDYRYSMQKRSAEKIREIINNEEQSEKLKLFMEDLRD